MSDLLWVGVPGGRSGGALVVRVVIIPRLDPGATLRQHGLGEWPPDQLRHTFVQIDFAESENRPVARSFEVAPSLADQPGVWTAFFDPDEPVEVPASKGTRQLDVDRTAAHAARVTGTYRRAARAMRDADSEAEFQRVSSAEMASYSTDEDAQARTPAEPLPPSGPVGFTRALSLLREHPPVLSALGLILELRLPANELPPFAAGAVRVRWEDAPASLPTIIAPWSAYRRVDFLPAPSGGSDLKSGMLALGRPHFRFCTFDVDVAIGRLRDACGSEEPGSATLPALRTAGIMLLRAEREGQLSGRTQAPATSATTLTADHLTLGYRVDARVAGDGHRWHSLCARRSTYEINDLVIADDLHEEGHIKPQAAIDHGDGKLCMDEVIARWDGWSMGAPRPTLGSRPGEPTERFRRTIVAEAATLLPLRFGKKYNLRVRALDIAGGGRPLDSPSPDGSDSDPILFARHEPVLPPILQLPAGLAANFGPGARIDHLVVRSGGTVPDYPADLIRILGAPTAAIDVVERHDKLAGDPVATFGLLRPDLPDPAAAGVMAYLRPEPGSPPPDMEQMHWPQDAWPDLDPKRLLLLPRGKDEPTLVWTSETDLVVRLSPAEQITLELSSYVDADLYGHFAVSNWIPEAAHSGLLPDSASDEPESPTPASRIGRHPMLTPARKVTLVHAIRRPQGTPAGALQAERDEGQTFVKLAKKLPDDERDPGDERDRPLGIDTASTGSLEISASWKEVDDEGTRTVPASPVGTLLVARGTTDLGHFTHEFGDTKHRVVSYTFRAISRFRHFFPDGDPPEDFTDSGELDEVHIRSSARPAPPVVRSAVPAFTWTESKAGHLVTRQRLGGRVRVELAPPWFMTGAGERLAVVFARGYPGPGSAAHYTQVGRDPLWNTAVPHTWPAVEGGTLVPLKEADEEVVVLPHEVWSYGGSWYADISFPMQDSYSPLVQLALARYQPCSLPGLELSAVVRTDFVPLLPDRTLTIDTTRLAASRIIELRLSGYEPAGPKANRVDISIEHQAGRSITDLIALDPGDSSAPAWVSVMGVGGRLNTPIEISLPELEALRLRIREIEIIGEDIEAPAGSSQELHERTVFTDVIAVPIVFGGPATEE